MRKVKSYSNRSSILLFEIIIAIAFFAVASTVCIQMFAKAYTVTERSKALDFAVTKSSSIASLIAAEDDIDTVLVRQYPEITREDETYTLFYDRQYRATDREHYYYRVAIAPATAGAAPSTYTISLNQSDSLTPLYSLDVACYQGRQTAVKEVP